jgi:hypothetical protein
MAPELRGAYISEDETEAHPVTLAVDIYSFGVVLREIITGERTSHVEPFTREIRLAAPHEIKLYAMQEACII